jgi:hypothetical protein
MYTLTTSDVVFVLSTNNNNKKHNLCNWLETFKKFQILYNQEIYPIVSFSEFRFNFNCIQILCNSVENILQHNPDYLP